MKLCTARQRRDDRSSAAGQGRSESVLGHGPGGEELPGRARPALLINGFVARKPQNRRSGNSRKVMTGAEFQEFHSLNAVLSAMSKHL